MNMFLYILVILSLKGVDLLTIYDGESTLSPELVPGSFGTSLLGQTFYASPTNESGALTITFTSDPSVTYPGWIAEIVVQLMALVLDLMLM